MMAREARNGKETAMSSEVEGPFDRFTTANDYWAQIEGLWNVVESVHVKHLSSDGDETVVLFDMATNCHTAPFAFVRRG
jgi:hypothetical protein